eukprot:Sspe_Gene.54164::Locus_29908_Transcript_2_3_Confidence_0.400_Length_1275::g.54164::m.54164
MECGKGSPGIADFTVDDFIKAGVVERNGDLLQCTACRQGIVSPDNNKARKAVNELGCHAGLCYRAMKECPDWEPARVWRWWGGVSWQRARRPLLEAYGAVEEVGHHTVGHDCVTEKDVREAEESGSSLLYGELLAKGVTQAIGAVLCGTPCPITVLELGMGTGKAALQLFAECSLFSCVYGVELAESRWKPGVQALQRLAAAMPKVYRLETKESSATLTERESGRELIFHLGDMLETPDHLLEKAGVVLLEVDLPDVVLAGVCKMLLKVPHGCRVISLHPLHLLWPDGIGPCPLRPLPSSSGGGVELATSWNPRGHTFWGYEVMPSDGEVEWLVLPVGDGIRAVLEGRGDDEDSFVLDDIADDEALIGRGG